MSERRLGPPLHDRLGALVRERVPAPGPGRAPDWLSRGRAPRRIGPVAGGALAVAALGLVVALWPAHRLFQGRARSLASQAPARPALLPPEPDRNACVHAAVGATGVDVTARASDQPWVRVGRDGRLEYRKDQRGNRVPDFSAVGYHGGEVEPPHVAASARAIQPGQADDAAAIQAALDAAAVRPPDARGFRGAVELAAGTFVLRSPLRITAGGVVLRGQGRATVLRAVGPFHPALVVGLPGTLARFRTAHAVADTYVPVGARTLTLADVAGLAVGDDVVIERPSTRSWECALGMDALAPRPDGTAIKPWPDGTELRMYRRIAAIDGRQITLEAPLPAALEREYTAATVRRYRLPERIAEVGVEALALEAAFSEPQRAGAEDALLDVAAVDDGWLRSVTVAGEVPIAVRLGRFSRRISVSDVVVAGGLAREVAFHLSGQLLLIERARAEGDQLRALLTTAATAGPNAVVDLQAVGEDQEVETQRRWAVGLLLDGVRVSDAAGRPAGVISVANQGNRGTGHGWSGANSMVWNSSARWIVVDSPPTASNWVTGGAAAALFGTGSFSGVGVPATPASLYQAQRAERLARR